MFRLCIQKDIAELFPSRPMSDNFNTVTPFKGLLLLTEWSWEGDQRLCSQSRLHVATGQQSGEHYGVAEYPRLEWWGMGESQHIPLELSPRTFQVNLTVLHCLSPSNHCIFISILYNAFFPLENDNDWMPANSTPDITISQILFL